MDSVSEIVEPSSEILTSKLSTFQSILDTYHISIVHVGLVVFILTGIVIFFAFEEKIKSFLRGKVRQLLFRIQTGGKENEVTTTSKTAESKWNQLLTYLEQTWLAPSDEKARIPLPTNVHLDDSYRIMSTEEESDEEIDEEGFRTLDV
jgi:hypothetical protein